MRIMHIASFAGNLGDIINHNGFYDGLKKYITNDIEIDQIEIRKFYNNSNQQKFDIDLVHTINGYDALVIGGGGFFDVRWNNSHTGTTLDFTDDFIDEIKIPVILNLMGYHESYDDDYSLAFNNFQRFIKKVSTKKNWFISIRNDGSFKRMQKRFGCEFLTNILKYPDSGFYFSCNNDYVERTNKIIGVNISNDLFFNYFTNNVQTEKFNSDILEYIAYILNKKYKLMFIAHTPKDIDLAYSLINKLNALDKRNNIIVAPYMPFDNYGAYEMKRYYEMCDLIVGMRFHSNILSIAAKTPVIGLAGHEQIEALYREIDMKDYCIRVGEENYIYKLIHKTDEILKFSNEWYFLIKKLYSNLYVEQKEYINKIKEFLEDYKNENR